MTLNDDYFDDLDITDDDIIEDDNLDVDGPEYELTLEEAKKLPEQYNHLIVIVLYQTSPLPRLFYRLDTIFEMYDIEHSLYVLTSYYDMDKCNTVVKFGNYQLFCEEENKDMFINNDYGYFYIKVYVKYPQFNYKRAFRFLYNVFNIFRLGNKIGEMYFENLDSHATITFSYKKGKVTLFGHLQDRDITLSDGLTHNEKRRLYNAVIHHFFGTDVLIDYKALERDVPIKPL